MFAPSTWMFAPSLRDVCPIQWVLAPDRTDVSLSPKDVSLDRMLTVYLQYTVYTVQYVYYRYSLIWSPGLPNQLDIH